MANSTGSHTCPKPALFIILGDALECHQVKIHEAKPQSNIKLEKKAEDEIYTSKDMNIRLLWI